MAAPAITTGIQSPPRWKRRVLHPSSSSIVAVSDSAPVGGLFPVLPVVTHNIPGSASNAGYVQASAVDVPPSSSSNDMGTYAGPPIVRHPEQPDSSAAAAAVIGGTVTPPGPALDPGDATSAPDTMDYEDIQAQKITTRRLTNSSLKH